MSTYPGILFVGKVWLFEFVIHEEKCYAEQCVFWLQSQERVVY